MAKNSQKLFKYFFITFSGSQQGHKDVPKGKKQEYPQKNSPGIQGYLYNGLRRFSHQLTGLTVDIKRKYLVTVFVKISPDREHRISRSLMAERRSVLP